MNAEIAVDARTMLGECPLWDTRECTLYWIDILAPAVHRWDPATGVHDVRPTPALVGSIALRESGGLIAALRDGFVTFDFATGAIERIGDPEAHLPENRFNDGRCDRAGRFWAGTMSHTENRPSGTLYRLDPDHAIHALETGIVIPNSLGFSPDDRTMYFADTVTESIFAYDFDIESGTLANKRLFASTADDPGHPDGSAVDAEGCLWNAQFGGARLTRYTPDGKVDRVVPIPTYAPTMCAFGGKNLDTLFVTSARRDLNESALREQPAAGSILAIDVGVRGLPEPRYAG